MAGSRLVIYVAPESGELEKEPGDGEDGAEEALIQPLQQPPRRDAAKVRERRRRRVAMTGCGSEDELWGGGANKGRSGKCGGSIISAGTALQLFRIWNGGKKYSQANISRPVISKLLRTIMH